MSSFKRHVKKDKAKWIITFMLISILIVSMIFAFVRIDRNEDTKTLGTGVFTYSVGVINENGKVEEGNGGIYTNDYYTVDGLVCDLADESTVTYKIFFYDAEQNFIESTDELAVDYDSANLPDGAEFFRIMITPVDDAEVTFFEIGSYGGQLIVTINK